MKRSIIILLFLSVQLLAQSVDSVLREIRSDSLVNLADSLNLTDSLSIIDSLRQKSANDIDAIVFAKAKDSLKFDVKNKEMYLYGEGDIKYKTTQLKSGNIKVNFETSELEAIGRKDTSDSLTSKFIETPVLVEASDTYEGTSIKYNFKTQQGFISLAKNSSDNKTYTGSKVKKMDKKTFFIADGKFTTCDADTPHYYFGADKMKIMQGDKIIARWIFMYIGGVPIPIPLPWGVFPNKTGRASGIIVPTYGHNATQGWYLRNMGYYYAINDYSDLALTGDYYFKGGYGLRGRFRYKKRYDFNGSINGGFSTRVTNEESDPDYSETFNWNINVAHNQVLSPTMQLDVRLRFMSGGYLKDNSPNLRDLVTQDITSNATFTKRWEGSGVNLTVNYNRTQNLETGNITEDLPNVSFSKSRVYPFRKKRGSSKNKSWYEYIGYNYSGRFKNNRKKYNGETTIHGGLAHTFAVSASPKFGHFSLSPSLTVNSNWYNKRQVKKFESVLDTLGRDSLYLTSYDINQFNTVSKFNFSLSTSTKIYGMAQPQMLGIAAFRHTFEPRLSYSYHPDFSEERWGYYDYYRDTTGQIIRYDKFGNQIFGGAGSGESQRLSLSLGNIFEMKTIKNPTDTTSESKKIRLLNMSISSGYNFVADSLNFDDVRVSFNTQIGRMLNIQGSSVFTPYEYRNGRTINQFLASNGKPFLSMTSFNVNFSSSLSAELFGSKKEKKEEEDTEDEFMKNDKDSDDLIELYRDDEPNLDIPWNLNLTYNYNYTNRGVVKVRSNLGADLSFSLTKKWKFTMRGSYDVTNKEFNAPQVTIYRELHEWEANLVWRPIGRYRGFRFEIRLKAPEFRDIKLTKSKEIFSGF